MVRSRRSRAEKAARLGLGFCALVAALPAAGAAQVSYPLKRIAASGDAPPGVPAGTVYSNFFGGSVSPDGRIAFVATMGTPAAPTSLAAGAVAARIADGAAGGAGTLLLRSGDLIPGTFFNQFGGFADTPAMNLNDRYALFMPISGPGVPLNSYGLVQTTAGVTADVSYRTDQPLPGLPVGSTTQTISDHRSAIGGDFSAFRAEVQLSGGTAASGVWSVRGSVVAPVALPGDNLPLLGVINGASTKSAVGDGDLLFRAFAPRPGGSFASGLYLDRAGQRKALAVAGQAVPLAPPGTVYSRGPSAVSGSRWGAVFEVPGTLGGSPLQALYRYRFESAQYEVVTGLGVPDHFDGLGTAVIGSVYGVSMSSDGRVAWRGTATGVGDGLFAGTPGDFSLVAISGNPAPGTGGAFFGTLGVTPVINAFGDIAFNGNLSDGRTGLWVKEDDAPLRALVVSGTQWELNPGVYRTIQRVESLAGILDTGTESGRPAGLNDLRQLSFILRFTDGTSALYVATIPEPGAVATLALVGGLLWRRRP